MEKIKKSSFVSKFLMTFAAVFVMTLAMGVPSKAANAPGQVTGVKQTDASSGTVYLEWNMLLNTDVRYEVYVCSSQNGDYNLDESPRYTTSSNSGSIYVGQGTTCYVKVRAYISNSSTNYEKVRGELSVPIEVVTAPSSSTSAIKHVKSTTSSISLSWNKVLEANYYIVEYGKRSDNRNKYKMKYVTGNSITLTKLSRNQTYTVYVYSARRSSKGVIAVGPYNYKWNIPVTPGKAGSLDCPYYWENLSEIRMECGDIPSADGYQWELYTSYKRKDTRIRTINSSSNGTYISNSALKKHRFYKVRVRAYCENSNSKKYYGAWSDWKYICQQPDMKLRNTSKGIKASWDKIDGADQYVVYVSNKPKSGYKKYCTTKNTSVTVSKYGRSKLKSGRRYYMYVEAKNKVGRKYYSGEAGNANTCWYITYRK